MLFKFWRGVKECEQKGYMIKKGELGMEGKAAGRVLCSCFTLHHPQLVQVAKKRRIYVPTAALADILCGKMTYS